MGAASPAAGRRLIVNADDLGLSPGVNAGIILAHTRGILTSATILANAPAFDEAVVLAKANPSLGVGLHLNLVRGRPLSPPETVPMLVDAAGAFRPFRLRRMSAGFLAQAETEYRSQFEKALAAGLSPTHIDFEKHHAWQGPLYHLACRLAAEYGVKAVRQLREPVAWSCRVLGWPGMKKAFMAAALRCGVALSEGRAPHLKRPDHLLGQYAIGGMTEAVWLRLLAHLPAGTTEVMTHPGKNIPENSHDTKMGNSWIDTAREMELNALISLRLRDSILAHHIELATFSNL